MITIEQLLESVDLDFEPRFVTKDNINGVSIWDYKPDRNEHGWLVDRVSRVVDYPYLKLAEFSDKNWQECIYEVPRKTTGKIARLTGKGLLLSKDENGKATIWTETELFNKINELVDAVNELKGAKNE